jgi:hypothetical protein
MDHLTVAFYTVDGRIFGRLATLLTVVGSSCLSIPRLSSQSRELLCGSSQNLFHLHYKLKLKTMKKGTGFVFSRCWKSRL